MIYSAEKLNPRRRFHYAADLDPVDRQQVISAIDELEAMPIHNPRDLMGTLYQASELMALIRTWVIIMPIHEMGHTLQIRAQMNNPLLSFAHPRDSSREVASLALVHFSTMLRQVFQNYCKDLGELSTLYHKFMLNALESDTSTHDTILGVETDFAESLVNIAPDFFR